MKIKYVIALALSLLITGCDNAAKFDGTSQESLRYSAGKVFEPLSEEKKGELKSAILDTMSYYDTEAELTNNKNYSSDNMRLVVFNGKTADQVLSEAAKYREKKDNLEKKYLHN